ncbi:hypothetical protein ABZ760_20230, partial [Streptomyces sp. NPDC006658]|uniref:hypothetical protein n=1 Tax=Streptomyces sp. NPDC006658 TaxID=3156900 RepID=UPI0033F6C2D2
MRRTDPERDRRDGHGPARELSAVDPDFAAEPAHHYTRGLLGSVLSLESAEERMTQIKGVVP